MQNTQLKVERGIDFGSGPEKTGPQGILQSRLKYP